MRDDPNGEGFLLHRRHRQAYAIDRHRAFVDDVTHHIIGRRDLQLMILALLFPRNNFPNAINVARDKVSAQSTARL